MTLSDRSIIITANAVIAVVMVVAVVVIIQNKESSAPLPPLPTTKAENAAKTRWYRLQAKTSTVALMSYSEEKHGDYWKVRSVRKAFVEPYESETEVLFTIENGKPKIVEMSGWTWVNGRLAMNGRVYAVKDKLVGNQMSFFDKRSNTFLDSPAPWQIDKGLEAMPWHLIITLWYGARCNGKGEQWEICDVDCPDDIDNLAQPHGKIKARVEPGENGWLVEVGNWVPDAPGGGYQAVFDREGKCIQLNLWQGLIARPATDIPDAGSGF